jgi:hypothetical protein
MTDGALSCSGAAWRGGAWQQHAAAAARAEKEAPQLQLTLTPTPLRRRRGGGSGTRTRALRRCTRGCGARGCGVAATTSRRVHATAKRPHLALPAAQHEASAWPSLTSALSCC